MEERAQNTTTLIAPTRCSTARPRPRQRPRPRLSPKEQEQKEGGEEEGEEQQCVLCWVSRTSTTSVPCPAAFLSLALSILVLFASFGRPWPQVFQSEAVYAVGEVLDTGHSAAPPLHPSFGSSVARSPRSDAKCLAKKTLPRPWRSKI